MLQDTLAWQPSIRQSDFLSLPDTVFEGLYGGAAGGGKTDTLMMLPIARGFHRHPAFKMLFLRRTFPELDNEVVIRSRRWYANAGFNPYQDQKKRWTHPEGGIIQFGHCEHEKDVTKYDTSEYNIIAFDELTSFSEFQYMYLTMSRCRSSTDNLPAFVRSGTNPGNIGHSFVRKRFVEPAPKGNIIIREKRTFHGEETVLFRIFIPSFAQDNPYLMKYDPGYIARLNALPEAEKAAKLYGDWWTFSGQVFDDWRILPYSDEPPNARHVIDEFRIPEYWPRVLSIDWGYSALTVAGWYAINPQPTPELPYKIIKYREYSARKQNISVWASDIARLSQGEQLADVVMDPSAWAHRGDEFTICEQFAQISGLSPRRADNDRVGGKILLQEYIRWRPKPPRYVPPEGFSQEIYDRLFRLKGPRAADDYTNLFVPEEPEILPKFAVFESCEETIKHIPLCVYSKNNPEDCEELKNDTDDFYDETRYGIKACQFYLDGGKAEFAEAEKRSKICSDLERTGNQTRFYMEMDRLERGIQARPMKRFHYLAAKRRSH